MLGFITWDFDPEIFNLVVNGHSLSLRWYGVLFAAGFILAQQVFYYVYRKDGKSRAAVDILTIYLIVATIIGARLGHYLFYEWPMLLQSPGAWFIELVTPPFSGLASHGATICIILSVYIYSHRYKDQPFLWVLDRLAIVTPVVGAMIRLGNLLNSEIYGVPTTLPWGFLFVRETDPSLLPLVPRHPTQVYEALFCLLLFGLTFYLWKYRRFTIPTGTISGLFIVLLFLFRFCVEFLKNDQVEFESDYLLNMGQVLSLPAMLAGCTILIFAFRNRRPMSQVPS